MKIVQIAEKMQNKVIRKQENLDKFIKHIKPHMVSKRDP